MATFLAAAGGIISFIGFVWLVVEAFRINPIWGVCCIFFNPIAAILFLFNHWEEGSSPILTWIVGFILSWGGYAMTH